jgi:hypothetical protein
MVVFYITVATLDIAMGVTWWITKTTAKGIYYGYYYLFYGNNPQKIYNKNDLMIEMTKLQQQIEYIQ